MAWFGSKYNGFSLTLKLEMLEQAKVVIGANYGDEGKGLMTDYFAAQSSNSLVIRFNGGCQAGHTVTTPDGARHVFSHFGSGSLACAATYLSKHFAVNPMLYLKERPKLSAVMGGLPLLYVDGRAPVTTLFDILLNQMVEDFRSVNRHGSCGMGFGETINRQEEGDYALVVEDLADGPSLRKKLRAIRDEYLPRRARGLGLPDCVLATEKATHFFGTDVLIDALMASASEFCQDATVVSSPRELVGSFESVVMEGAQGLMLDQTRGAFPFVTRSNTGLTNVVEVALESGIDKLAVSYVSRAYLTRHGAGPLAKELGHKPYAAVVDPTNMPNDYQGSLRFAYLDHDLLATSIAADLASVAGTRVVIEPTLAISCLDQIGLEAACFWRAGELVASTIDAQLLDLGRITTVANVSFGPSREHVQ